VFVASWTGEELDSHHASGNVDAPGVRGFRARPVADGHSGGAGTRSAGLGLPHAAFMHAHCYRADAVVDQRL
jgi:hypothetical protein